MQTHLRQLHSLLRPYCHSLLQLPIPHHHILGSKSLLRRFLPGVFVAHARKAKAEEPEEQEPKPKRSKPRMPPKQKQFPETLQGVTKEIGTATSASNTANYSPVSGVLPTTTSMALRDTSSKVGNEPSMVEAECHISHAPGSHTDCHMNKVL